MSLSTWVLKDGQVIPIDPTINAGTAAVQYFFSQLDDLPGWERDVNVKGLILTYYVFFGNPFNYAIEPLLAPDLSQPALTLPFKKGKPGTLPAVRTVAGVQALLGLPLISPHLAKTQTVWQVIFG